MSKVVKIYNSNYKIAVQDGGTITLDTGNLTGDVIVTGNLEVKGTTTTVDSTQVTIADNIIILSSGTVGTGIPASVGYISGIEIERGSLPNARWIFDEQLSWNLGGTNGLGTFYAIAGTQKLPINTPGIIAQGNLYVNTGNGVISVTNTSDYEEKIWTYIDGVITPDASLNVVVDDDHIPNAKAVKDYVDYIYTSQAFNLIAQGNSSVTVIDQNHTITSILSISPTNNTTTITVNGPHGFTINDTVNITGVTSGDQLENLNGTNIPITEIVSVNTFRVGVNTVGANVSNYVTNSGTITKTGVIESRIKFDIEGFNVGNIFNNRTEIESIKIQDNEISTTASNQSLILSAPGSGTVKINDVLEIRSSPWDDDAQIIPLSPESGVKIYTNNIPGSDTVGNTGIYFVNSNEKRDEIISKNRSLLFSMLF